MHSEPIKSIRYLGKLQTFNIEVDSKSHLYYSDSMIGLNSHSVSYAMTSYQTMYLKTHFPTEFYTAWLTFSQWKIDPKEEISELVDDAKLNNIKVLPPRVTDKNDNFIIVDKNKIRFGILHIRNIGAKTIEQLNKSDVSNWVSFFKSIKKIKRNVAQALVKSGACDLYNLSRIKMLRDINTVYGGPVGDKSDDIALKPLSLKELAYVIQHIDSQTIPSILQSILDEEVCVKARRNIIEQKIIYNNSCPTKDTSKQNAVWEKIYLGHALTCSAADDYKIFHKDVRSCRDAYNMREKGSRVVVHVVLDKVKPRQTSAKAKNPDQNYCYIEVSDNSAPLTNVVCWPENYEKYAKCFDEGSVMELELKLDIWGGRPQWSVQRAFLIG